jgi:hypothetical protein
LDKFGIGDPALANGPLSCNGEISVGFLSISLARIILSRPLIFAQYAVLLMDKLLTKIKTKN